MNRPFWERPEQVERFAERPPDKRLLKLLKNYKRPEDVRVLDLGCAGGRNTVVLATKGFDVYAVDTSFSMVEKTRERVAQVLGLSEAKRRVRIGQMDNLQDFASESFHLVVALGVYQNALNQKQWNRTLKETARILFLGGQVLVANFSPGSDPEGTGLNRVMGKRNLYEGFTGGPLFLLEPHDLDTEMDRHGLRPIVSTESVVVKTDAGKRVTVNGFFRKETD